MELPGAIAIQRIAWGEKTIINTTERPLKAKELRNTEVPESAASQKEPGAANQEKTGNSADSREK